MRRPFMTTQEHLSRHTSFHIGGPAELFFRPDTQDELARVVRFCRSGGLPVRMIGRGTNLLINDTGIAGAVVATTGVDNISVSGDTITAECGASLPQILRLALDSGLSGLEPLAGIPGSLGGAVKMNAGTPGGTVADLLDEISVLTADGTIARRRAGDINFGYRRCGLGDDIVLSARLKLARSSSSAVHERMQQHLCRKQTAQPVEHHSAGCVFKNPPGESAGAILDRLGLKGSAVGRAGISQKHANFIINRGGATAADVLALISKARSSVLAATGVQLELEVEVW